MVDKENFLNCDVLENLPTLHAENYNFETEYLIQVLPAKAKVLQVGSMDGTRLLRLFEKRPDLILTGLEIEPALVVASRSLLKHHKVAATIIEGDITQPPALGQFDYVICLNHTSGYIPNQHQALAGMKKLGKHVIVSVYGENWTPELAQEYFTTLGLAIMNTTPTQFTLSDGSTIHRYTRKEIDAWGGKARATPLGYLVFL